jgi:hypothetical protein
MGQSGSSERNHTRAVILVSKDPLCRRKDLTSLFRSVHSQYLCGEFSFLETSYVFMGYLFTGAIIQRGLMNSAKNPE